MAGSVRTADLAVASSGAIRSADGYSRFVGSMKVLLPVVAAVLVLLVIAWPDLTGHVARFRLDATPGLDVASGTTQRLVEARFTGTDAENHPYNLTAKSASASDDDKTLIVLDKPKADITLDDGTWIALIADRGAFRTDDEILTLYGSVDLFHDQGYELRTEEAVVDLKQRIAYGSVPITGQGPFGSLSAEGFRVTDQGKRILFTGKARLSLHPELVGHGSK